MKKCKLSDNIELMVLRDESTRRFTPYGEDCHINLNGGLDGI